MAVSAPRSCAALVIDQNFGQMTKILVKAIFLCYYRAMAMLSFGLAKFRHFCPCRLSSSMSRDAGHLSASVRSANQFKVINPK